MVTTERTPGDDAFGERPIDDLLGEALRRYRHGAMRPYWRDMPEGEQKRAWRRLGAALLEQGKPEDWVDRYTLPCPVKLPPNTVIAKGCTMRALITGLIAREPIEGQKSWEFAT